MKTSNNFLTAAMLVAVAVTVAGPALAGTERGSFERTLQVSGPVDLDLRSPYGNITVRTGAGNEVRVRADIRAKSKGRHKYSAEEKVRLITENPPVEQTGNRIRIGYIDDKDLEKDVRIHYELVVPAETELRARTGYGDVTVAGVRRPAEIKSGYGDIELSSPAGRVEVSTGYGDIRVEGAPTADWRLTTGYGKVRLRLPPDAAFELSARSGYGSVHTDHPLTVQGSFRPNRMRATVRGGGPVISIRTGYGSIWLE